jgi:hypothetical protein
MKTKELIALLDSLDCERCPNETKCKNLHNEPCLLFNQAAERLEELAAENERLKRKATTNCDDWIDD